MESFVVRLRLGAAVSASAARGLHGAGKRETLLMVEGRKEQPETCGKPPGAAASFNLAMAWSLGDLGKRLSIVA